MRQLKCDVILVQTYKQNFVIGDSLNPNKFHIWFVSDRPIQPGNIIYDPHGPNLIGFAGNGWHKDCKKVYATSDDTFFFPTSNLQLISQPFIKKYIYSKYSINEVLIEMSDKNPDIPRLRDNNTVITHKKQYLYRPEEIKVMIRNAVTSYAYQLNPTIKSTIDAKDWANEWCQDLF